MFLAIIIIVGIVIALSIRLPLRQIMTSMQNITSGDYDSEVQAPQPGRDRRDGTCGGGIRENAIAKREADDELRASKERPRASLLELNAAQQNLIRRGASAALAAWLPRRPRSEQSDRHQPDGGLEFARRAGMFEPSSGPTRHCGVPSSRTSSGPSQDAAQQLVANLHRAGELFVLQAGRSGSLARGTAAISLSEATDQIIASLRPVLKRAPISISVEVPDGLMIDGFPGSYGQILTNLFSMPPITRFPTAVRHHLDVGNHAA